MILVRYLISATASCVFTLLTYLLAPIVCLSVQSNGYLPRWLSWFGTPDNPATGDPTFWPQAHPTYSLYQLAVTWMWRNPAMGFDQVLAADVAENTMVDVYGNLDIDDVKRIGGWYFLTGGGVFQFKAVWPIGPGCFQINIGWSLTPIAKNYSSTTLGALCATPLRYFMGKSA